MTGGPDWFARTLAIIAICLTVIQYLTGRWDGVWRRRASNSSGLREQLDDLVATLDAADTPRGAANLWTGTFDVAMNTLLLELASVADRRLERKVKELHRCLVGIRGMSTPTNADLLGAGVTLNANQRRLLDQARAAAKAAVQRNTEAIRKGGKP